MIKKFQLEAKVIPFANGNNWGDVSKFESAVRLVTPCIQVQSFFYNFLL